jgi:hypothetical protein
MLEMKSESSTPGIHQNQVFSQVILPFLFFLILVVSAGFLLFSRISSGAFDMRVWADISVILIFLPLLMFFVIILLVIFLSIALITGIQKKVVSLFMRLNLLSSTIKDSVAKTSHSFIQPLIFIITRLPNLKRK